MIYTEPVLLIVPRSLQKEDELRLRFIPYFGEHDELDVDHNAFSSEHDGQSDMLEIDDHILLRVCEKYGTSPAVFNALKNCRDITVTTLRNRYVDCTSTLKHRLIQFHVLDTSVFLALPSKFKGNANATRTTKNRKTVYSIVLKRYFAACVIHTTATNSTLIYCIFILRS
jgi:hypothetical protein